MLRILSIAVLFCLATIVQAHDEAPLFNKVSLQAETQREVPNDEMRVTLVAEQQGSNPATLSQRVNDDMTWALEQAKKDDTITAETQGYSTQPIYNDGVIRGWRSRQELQLKSAEFTRLTELLGKLQERLQIVQMGFSPTPATRQKHENELITEAIQSFKKRIAIIQQNMDGQDYRIIEMNVNTGGFGYRPMAVADRGMSTMERSAPAVEAGTTEVMVTVSGSIQFY